MCRREAKVSDQPKEMYHWMQTLLQTKPGPSRQKGSGEVTPGPTMFGGPMITAKNISAIRNSNSETDHLNWAYISR